MQSTLKLRDSDPHDDFAIAPEVVPAAWADKVLADITRDAKSVPDVKSLRRQAARLTSAALRTIAALCRGANGRYEVSRHRHRRCRRPGRAAVDQPVGKSAVMLVFAICSAAAAAAWQNHGDAAKQMISNWVPAFAITSSPPTENGRARRDRPIRLPLRSSAAEQTPAPPAAPAQPPESAAPAAAAPSPDTAQLESMARDLAAMAQQVEQLKASIAELKASQQAMARDAARTSEVKPAEIKPAAPNPRPRTAAPPPRTAAAPRAPAAAGLSARAGLSTRAGRGTRAVAAIGLPSGVNAVSAATAAGHGPGGR